MGLNVGQINNSYSTGSVSGASTVGGLVGNQAGTITNSYWNNHSGNPNDCYNGGNTGCTAIDNSESYFFDVSNPPMANWSYPPWDNFCDDKGYTPLELENITDVTECKGYTPTPPTVILVSPADDYEDIDGNITFSCNATDDIGLNNLTLWTNISGTWQANETNTITGTANETSFYLTGIDNGTYLWNCQANNTNGDSDFDDTNNTFSVIVPILPNSTEFNISYGSTNFSAVPDITNVTNLTLATQYGRIQFPNNYGVDAYGQDYDTYVEIGDGFISVNTSVLDSTFNASSNLTINNVNCPADIYYGDSIYTTAQDIINEENICNSSSNPSCTNINCIGNNLTFTISHFTGFASAGSANLTIWDETDSGMPYGDQTKYAYDQVKFFANYTNATGAIQGANCSINFTDSSAYMDYNTTGFYEYNRTFTSTGTYNWNVTCNKTGFSTLTATDTVSITQFIISGVWCGSNCFFSCGNLANTADNDWNTYGCGGWAQPRRNITIPTNTVSASWNFKYDTSNTTVNLTANCYNYSSNSWSTFYTSTSQGLFNVTVGVPSECLNSNILQVEVDLKNQNSIYYEGQAAFTISTPPPIGGGGGGAPTCSTIWDCTPLEGCQPDPEQAGVHYGTQKVFCEDIGTCNSGTKNETRFCLYEPPPKVEYEVSPQPGEEAGKSTGKGIKSSGYFTTKSLQKENLSVEFTYQGDEPIEDIKVNIETPEKSTSNNVYITKVSAGGKNTELTGFSTFSIMKSDLLKWNITPKLLDKIEPGEKVGTNFSFKTPLTDYEQGELRLIVSSDGTIFSNQTINISIDVPEFLVIPDIHEDEPDIMDLYMVMFNKENKDREFNIEFNLNRNGLLQKTIIAEYYGPYTIKANNITIAAYRYKFSSNLAGSNYILKTGLYENDKKIAESEETLDLTDVPITEEPFVLSSKVISSILQNIVYLLVVLTVILFLVLISIYRHKRIKIHRSIKHYKESRVLANIAKKARKRREIERKLIEQQKKKRRKTAKRAAKIRAARKERETENRRKAAEIREKRLKEEKEKRIQAAKEAAELRKQRREEEKEAGLKASEKAKQRREELKILKETETERRKETARKTAELETERKKQEAENRRKAAKRAVKLLAERLEQKRKIQLKRGKERKIKEEIKHIKKTKKKR
jgi:hypothetical protein